MPPKKRGKTKETNGRKRKGKNEEEETTAKKKLADDEMDVMREDINPSSEISEDDLPSTSKGKGPPNFEMNIIENKANRKESDGPATSSRNADEINEIPQFVKNIIEKKAKELATMESAPSYESIEDERDPGSASMRELTTLLRILSRGRYEEISEREAARAISNTGTDEMIEESEGVKEDSSSSESEDEWEEIELADPDEEGKGPTKNLEVRVSGSGKEKEKVNWKTKWLRTEVNRKVRENRTDLEKILFLSLLAHCRYLSRAALDEQLIPSMMLTAVPSGYLIFLGEPPNVDELGKLLKWFSDAFRPSRDVVVAPRRDGYRFRLTARLEEMIGKKEYEDCTDAALFLFALFHSFEWITRLVKNFSLHLPWEKEEKSKGRNRKNGKNKLERIDSWVEVWMKELNKWICIDPLSGVFMKDEEVEARLSQPLQYAIAIDNKFGIRETAFRFTTGFSTPKLKKRRKMDDWIKETLDIAAFRADGTRARAEDLDFHARINNGAVPTKIADLKGHPLYVLEKDLKKYEGIYPKDKEPAAVVRNEKVFLRADVYHLQGSLNWIKFGREIKEGEEPYKVVSKKAKVAGGEAESLPLYGFWQTKKYDVPQIVEGKIPRNEFGNIYMYKPEMCPKGAVHLRFPGMVAMARTLDLQAIPAVVGWQCQGGRNVPILEGAVVLEEDALIFTEKMKMRVREEREKQLKKRESRIWGNWRKLISGVMRLKRLNEKFSKKEEDHF